MKIDPDDNHVRAAEFVKIVDGDTFWASLVVLRAGSFDVRLHCKIRVHNYSAAELSEPTGPALRDAFEQTLRGAANIRLRVYDMSHDRWVCDVWIDNVEFGQAVKATLARSAGER